MKTVWKLHEAKSHFSELVECAVHDGPQTITKHGKGMAVLLSAKDNARLKGRKESLVEFFRRSPMRGLELDRTKDYPREVSLDADLPGDAT
jgi:prevent-host-death family protein